MEIDTLQRGLLDWLWLSEGELKSFASIEKRCINLYAQYYPDKDRSLAKYMLFFPLLRSGVVEFYGQDQYGIAPSCALKTGRGILLVNPPTSITRQTKAIPVQPFPGIYQYRYTKELNDLLVTMDIACYGFSFENSLSQFSNIGNIVQSWLDTSVSDPGNYLVFKDKWMSYSDLKIYGIYKKTNAANAHRLCLLESETWKIIPSRETNPDAFALAVLWSKMAENQKLKIRYHLRKQVLVIRENLFPFLIERLIIINALLNGIDQNDLSKREYFMEPSHLRILNKLMGDKIELYDE